MTSTAAQDTANVTAVIGAMAEEVEALLAGLDSRRDEAVGGFELHRGRLEGREVELALCGIGKVNAAALAQLLIGRGAGRVVFTGVAGAVDPALRVGDLVIGTDAVQHDLDVTALGYELGRVPGEPFAWEGDRALRAAARSAADEVAAEDGLRVVEGRIASGDRFIADAEEVRRLRSLFGAACAEMEGAAVAQVAAKHGVPWVVIRSISDTADGDAGTDFRAFTPLAAARAERVVRGLLRRL